MPTETPAAAVNAPPSTPITPTHKRRTSPSSQTATTTSPARVLVLTQVEDPTADLVVDELNRRAVPLVRIDTGDFPAEVSLAATLAPRTGRWSGELRFDRWAIALDDVRAIYYRRPSEFRVDPRLSEPERRFAVTQARHALSGVLSALPGVRWVNHPSAMADARVKPYQLSAAARCGLRVPPTMLTTIPETVPAFGEAHGSRLITKPLAAATITEQGRHGVAYTTTVSTQDWEHPGIAATAHLFQPELTGRDVRVTMIGTAVFAATIVPHDDNGTIDIRAHHQRVDYVTTTVPPTVAHRCRDLLDMLGLEFGAFDFRVDEPPDGDGWTLLELNPNGQWAFVPALRQHIASAIADVLESHNT